ncbi:MAG: hypothetical protein ACUVSY_07770 [Roseiflexus sp.]
MRQETTIPQPAIPYGAYAAATPLFHAGGSVTVRLDWESKLEFMSLVRPVLLCGNTTTTPAALQQGIAAADHAAFVTRLRSGE